MGVVGVSWVPGPLGQHVLIDIRECKQDYAVSRPPAVQGGQLSKTTRHSRPCLPITFVIATLVVTFCDQQFLGTQRLANPAVAKLRP